MVLTWSSAFVLLHLIRKGDVRKETSGKRCWRICNNHCRSSNMFSCKSSECWLQTRILKQTSLVFIFQTQATLKVLGEHRGHVRFIGYFAKLQSCVGGVEKSGGFQEKTSFTSVGQFGRDLGSLTVGVACSNMFLSNKDNEDGKKSLKIGGFAVKLLLVHWTAWAKEGNKLGNKVWFCECLHALKLS